MNNMNKILMALAGHKETTTIAWWCFGGDLAAAMRYKRIEARLKKLGANNPEFRVIKLGDTIVAHDGSTKVELHRCQYTGDFIVVINTMTEELEEFLVREKGFKAFPLRSRAPEKRVRREAAKPAFKARVIDARHLAPAQGCNANDVLEEIRERLLEEGESPLQTTVDGHVHVSAPWGQMRLSALSNGNTVAVVLWAYESIEVSPYDGRDCFNALVDDVKSAVDADSLAEFSETKVARLLRADCECNSLMSWHE